MRGLFEFAAVVGIVLVIAVTYVLKTAPSDNPLMAATSSEASGSVPTPQYLFEHPDALKEAELKCHDHGVSSSLYCSNVHKAESLRMADQYRRALKSGGAAQ
jgi:hypothetical protein